MLNTDTLTNCVYGLRAEVGHSLNAAQGTNTVDVLKYLLKRTQQDLWTNTNWPTLKISADVPMAAGQYLYAFPTGFSFEQVGEVWTSISTGYNWQPVGYGINDSMIKPGGGNSQIGDNVQFWDVEGDTQFRIWPTPATANYTVRFNGQRLLGPFIADSDMSTLDSTLIVLFTAAEVLARAKAEDASLKLQKAQKYMNNLLINSITSKRKVSTLASGAPWRQPDRQRTPFIDFIPTVTSS